MKVNEDGLPQIQFPDSPITFFPFGNHTEEAGREEKEGSFLFSQSNLQAPPVCDAFSLPLGDKSDVITLTIRILWQNTRFHPSN